MKLTDLPKHILDLDPPDFIYTFQLNYGGIFPKFDEDIIPLFGLGFYDGVLSGMFACRGRHFYSVSIYDQDRRWWAAWEVAGEDLERTLARHDLFRQYVGTHCDYIRLDGKWVRHGEVKPKELHPGFYGLNFKETDWVNKYETQDMFGIILNPFDRR